MTGIRAVTFDAGGTLIEPWPSVGAIYAEVAAEFAVSCEPSQLDDRFRQAWRARRAFGYTKEEWFEVVRQTFLRSCDVSRELFDAIYERFAREHAWLVYEDVIPTLQELAAAGIKLAVISNWDERLGPLLKKLGLDAYFCEIVVSSALGMHKPDPRIFHNALDRLGEKPENVIHIGDSEREDIEGARAAGLQAFRIRRSGAIAPHERTRLTGLLARLNPAVPRSSR